MAMKIVPSKELLERTYCALRGVGEQGKVLREVIAKHLGLNSTDLLSVDFLRSHGGACTAGELAEATGLTSGSATALIDRLEKAGYAKRESDPNDRRRQVVRLNDEQIARCEKVYVPIQKDLFRLWSGYSPEQLEAIEDFINRSLKIHAQSVQRLRAQSRDSHEDDPDSLRRPRRNRSAL